jgi:hypothetical protein
MELENDILATEIEAMTSVSGGRTSAYLAANYPTKYNVFALVRVEDPECLFPDKKIRQWVEDRIQKPFIGTAEDDMIIYTMMDLEQYLGRPIQWVSGLTFEQVIQTKGGWVPNMLHRYCTTWLKLDPIFYWWAENIGEPIRVQIGYRANELKRANDMLAKANENGNLEYEGTLEKWTTGRHAGLNKWETIEWQKPSFPLIEDGIFKYDITKFWNGKAVRFAKYNNCVGCFHRSAPFLKYQFTEHPTKMNWFKKQEKPGKGFWKSDNGLVIPYSNIEKLHLQQQLFADDFASCDDGYCGL